MKNSFKNWNFRRWIYLVGGIAFIAIAIQDQTWWMALFGIYFAGMSIFKLGCASGNCSTHLPEKEIKKK